MATVVRSEEQAAARDASRFASTCRTDDDRVAAFRVQPDAAAERSLSALIESEIIPRLMVAHRPATPALALATSDARVLPGEVEAFMPLVMEVQADAVLAHVEAMLARGVAFDTMMVDLLAPTARLLGEYWEEDRCDFVEVTMGLWRLQQVVHEIAGRAAQGRTPAAGARRALFASMPGDQHNFGTVVVDELFRNDGWLTERLSEAETPELVRRVADGWFDVVGLTVSCDCHIATLPSLIASLRSVSRNARVCVMVGGRIFSANPELALHVGADGTARDARLALKIADTLVRERAGALAAGH